MSETPRKIRQKCLDKFYKTRQNITKKKSKVWGIFHEIYDDKNKLIQNSFYCTVCRDVVCIKSSTIGKQIYTSQYKNLSQFLMNTVFVIKVLISYEDIRVLNQRIIQLLRRLHELIRFLKITKPVFLLMRNRK